MKPNDPHHWLLVFSGPVTRRAMPTSAHRFVGTFDEALARADEIECDVDFDVTQFILTRGPNLKSKEVAG